MKPVQNEWEHKAWEDKAWEDKAWEHKKSSSDSEVRTSVRTSVRIIPLDNPLYPPPLSSLLSLTVVATTQTVPAQFVEPFPIHGTPAGAFPEERAVTFGLLFGRPFQQRCRCE